MSSAAGFNEPVTDQMFEDVPSNSPFFASIGRLAARQVMAGYVCGGSGEPCGGNNLPYFRSGNNATRGQLAKIVSNTAGFIQPITEQTFEDVDPSSTFNQYIERLVIHGAMSGYPCGGLGEPCGASNRPYFRPVNNVTRGQTSKIVGNIFFPDCQVRRLQ